SSSAVQDRAAQAAILWLRRHVHPARRLAARERLAAFRRAATHEAAAPALADDQPAPRRLGISAGDGGEVEAERCGKLALGGELLAGLDHAEPHIVSQRIGNGEIEGLAVGGEIGTPAHDSPCLLYMQMLYKSHTKSTL